MDHLLIHELDIIILLYLLDLCRRDEIDVGRLDLYLRLLNACKSIALFATASTFLLVDDALKVRYVLIIFPFEFLIFLQRFFQ